MVADTVMNNTDAPAAEPKTAIKGEEEGLTSKDYYFDSYAHFGTCLLISFSLFISIILDN